jgi:hypothetical protein
MYKYQYHQTIHHIDNARRHNVSVSGRDILYCSLSCSHQHFRSPSVGGKFDLRQTSEAYPNLDGDCPFPEAHIATLYTERDSSNLQSSQVFYGCHVLHPYYNQTFPRIWWQYLCVLLGPDEQRFGRQGVRFHTLGAKLRTVPLNRYGARSC